MWTAATTAGHGANRPLQNTAAALQNTTALIGARCHRSSICSIGHSHWGRNRRRGGRGVGAGRSREIGRASSGRCSRPATSCRAVAADNCRRRRRAGPAPGWGPGPPSLVVACEPDWAARSSRRPAVAARPSSLGRCAPGSFGAPVTFAVTGVGCHGAGIRSPRPWGIQAERATKGGHDRLGCCHDRLMLMACAVCGKSHEGACLGPRSPRSWHLIVCPRCNEAVMSTSADTIACILAVHIEQCGGPDDDDGRARPPDDLAG